jgi:hypothetical protein
MKRLMPETFLGYEIISYEYYVLGKRQIISYAYPKGMAKDKEKFEFQATSNKKQYTLRMLKKQILENNNIEKITKQELKDKLINNHKDLLYIKDGLLMIYHPENFYWLKKQIKTKYNHKIKLEGTQIKW